MKFIAIIAYTAMAFFFGVGALNAGTLDSESKVSRSAILDRCVGLATVFSRAAMHREIGRSPQDAWELDIAKEGGWAPIDSTERKKIINQVYFDKAFAGIPAQAMRNAVMDVCMNPRQQFEPLK